MIELKDGSVFDNFFKQRDSLIRGYGNGDISKREFLEANYNSVQEINIKPFARVNSYEKGMYNYQYYNVLAKYYNMLSKEVEDDFNLREKFREYRESSNTYYEKKDQSTLKLLKYLNFEDVEVYFVTTESTFLNNKLFEIVLNNYEFAILHSKSTWLLRVLRDERVFTETKKISLIDGYINEKY